MCYGHVRLNTVLFSNQMWLEICVTVVEMYLCVHVYVFWSPLSCVQAVAWVSLQHAGHKTTASASSL